MKEVWAKIIGHQGYEVSTFGRVKSLKWNPPKILSPSLDGVGYVRMGELGSAHRLVALAFIKNPEGKKEVNHKNGIKWDNRVSNLEWATRGENESHAFATGLKKALDYRGVKNNIAKLNEKQIRVIKHIRSINKFAKPYTLAVRFSKVFNVHPRTLYEIWSGKTWPHIKIKAV